jgi:hypothetical protein
VYIKAKASTSSPAMLDLGFHGDLAAFPGLSDAAQAFGESRDRAVHVGSFQGDLYAHFEKLTFTR